MNNMTNLHKTIVAGVAILIVGLIVSNDRMGALQVGDHGGEMIESIAHDGAFGKYAEESVSNLSFAADSFIPEPPRGGDTAADVDQRIIKTGYMTLLVDKILDTIPNINEVAEIYNGFTQNTNSGEFPTGEKYGYVTIRVPSENYEDAVRDIRALSIKVIDESSDSQDVTEQYTDLQSRLEVAEEEEEAYLRLLDQSGSVGDLLQVQRELSNVRVKIESLEGRIKYLENQTELSTITVTLQQEKSLSVPTKPFRFESVVKDALFGAISIAQGVLTVIVWTVIIGITIVLPLGLVYWVGRNLWNRKK
jgi:hypothetical protein